MSTFDPNIFMQSNIDGVLDTKLLPHTAGEFVGMIGMEEKDVAVGNGTDKNGKPWVRLSCQIKTEDPSGQLFAAMGRTPQVRYDFLLDLSETGGLDLSKGRNIKLGQLREAVGQNKPGPWNFAMLKGQRVKFKVEHEARREDPTIIDARVVKVTSPSGM